MSKLHTPIDRPKCNSHSSTKRTYIFSNNRLSVEYTEDSLPARNYILYATIVLSKVNCQSVPFKLVLETFSFIDRNVCVFLFVFFLLLFIFLHRFKYSVHFMCAIDTYTMSICMVVWSQSMMVSLSLSVPSHVC